MTIMKTNIPPMIHEKLGKNLHLKKNHPIEIIKRKIYNYFGNDFKKIETLPPQVNIEDNFDKLLIKKDHPSRKHTDTYYVDDNTVLRTHTSAHQNQLLVNGERKFLVTGDVYRKDTVDSSHYPVFHQMEGVCIFENGENAEEELKKTMVGLVNALFPGCTYRMNSDYFPFTEPSFEVEVEFKGKWLEILGCGVVHKDIMNNCGIGDKTGWAFGLGLERLAMILFNIPDIRYFWTDDERFISQFRNGDVIEFKEYSKFPPCIKDISFWISDKFNLNDFCEIVRDKGEDLIEEIKLVDEFTNPKSNKTSHCYRIIYRSNERNLTNEEIDKIQEEIRINSEKKMNVEIR